MQLNEQWVDILLTSEMELLSINGECSLVNLIKSR